MKKCFFVIICLTFCRIDLTFAQLQTDELPISFSQPNFTLNNRTVNGMTVYQLPSLNNDQLLQEATTQAENCKNCRSLYYGKEMSLDIDLKQFGSSYPVTGGMLYQMELTSATALGLQIGFENFRLQEGEKVFIYSKDRKEVYGAFTEANNSPNGRFLTRIVSGNEVVVEYFVPEGTLLNPAGSLKINKFVHSFNSLGRSTDNPGFNVSGSCTINVNCSDQYNKEKKAVVMWAGKKVNGLYSFCTGSLINTTEPAGNKTPYIISAAHCFEFKGSQVYKFYDETIFYFEYETEGCENEFNDPLRFAKSLSGAFLRSRGDKVYSSSKAKIYTDYVLFELQTKPENIVDVTYLGWDRSTFASQNLINISHPFGDVKKVAFTSEGAIESGNKTGCSPGEFSTSKLEAWIVNQWTSGVTQPASSGSPLINDQGRLIGIQYGGVSRCSDSTPPPEDGCQGLEFKSGPDDFSRFNFAWDHSNVFISQGLLPEPLSKFLDPFNENPLWIDSYEPPVFVDGDGDTGGGIACIKDLNETGLSINGDDGERLNVYCIDSDFTVSPTPTMGCPRPRWELNVNQDSWGCNNVPSDLAISLCSQRIFGRCRCDFIDLRIILWEADTDGFPFANGASGSTDFRVQVEESSNPIELLNAIDIKIETLNRIFPLVPGQYYGFRLRHTHGGLRQSVSRGFRYMVNDPITLSGLVTADQTTKNDIVLNNATVTDRVVFTAQQNIKLTGNTVMRAGILISDQDLCEEVVNNRNAVLAFHENDQPRNLRVVGIGEQELHGPPVEATDEEIPVAQILVYPNPSATGRFQVQCKSDDEVCHVQVFGLNGRELSSDNVRQNVVDLSDESKGIYLLKIITEEGTFTKKVIYE